MDNTPFEKVVMIILGIAFVAMMLALSFALTSAIIYDICWAFKLVFTWRFAFGIWLILLIMRSVLRSDKDD